MAVLPQLGKLVAKAGTKAADELIPVGFKQGDEAAPVVAKTQPREADDLTKLNEQQVFEKYQDTSGMPPARATQADPKAVPQSQIIPAFQKLPDANARGLERYSNDTQEEMLGVMRLPQSNSTLMSVSLGDLADLIQHTKGVDSSRAVLRGTDEGFANGKLVKPIVVEATIEGGTIVPKSILHGKSTLKYMAEEGKEIDRALTTALVQFTDEAGIPLPISGLKEIPETLQLGGRAIEADLPLLSRKSVSNPTNTAPTRETIEQYFQPQALARVEREASGNSRTTIAMLTPRQFLALAQDGKDPYKAAGVAKVRKDGEAFDEVPFLHINMYDFREEGKPLANVEGHEGRHRMRQLIEEGAGDTPMPVAIKAMEQGELPAPRWSSEGYELPAFIRKEGSEGRRFNYDAEALPFPKTYPTLDEALAASAPPTKGQGGAAAVAAAPVAAATAGQIDENSPVAKFISSKELSSSVPLLKVYEDATKDSTGKGIPTVGHGHAFGHYNEKTKKNVIKTKEVAAYNKLSPADQQKQVDKWFREDLQAAEKSAQKFAGNRWSQLTDGQKLALTSLAFNVGDLTKKAPDAFAALKNNDFPETAHQLFSKAEGFVNAGGKYNAGLYKRRQAELAYWDGTN